MTSPVTEALTERLEELIGVYYDLRAEFYLEADPIATHARRAQFIGHEQAFAMIIDAINSGSFESLETGEVSEERKWDTSDRGPSTH